MELCEAHWRGQNAAAQGRTIKGQDRGAVGQHQERAPTCPVILPSTNCRLYYRLLSNWKRRRSDLLNRQATITCCCCGCGYVGDAAALSKRSGISTASPPSAPAPLHQTVIGVRFASAWCGRR